MSASIAHCRLTGPSGGGAFASLSNEHCVIELENVDNDYIRFEFHRPGEKKPVWELADYLDCRFMEQGGSFKLRPKPPGDLSIKEQFEWYLQRFDELLVQGYLNAPLNGDYSWESDYKSAAEEYERLSIALAKLVDAKFEGADKLWRMLIRGDQSWMAEVRKILADQEGRKQD